MLDVIVSFKNDGTEDIFNGHNSNQARRVLPRELWKIAVRKLDLLDAADALSDLRIPPANRLEALKVIAKDNIVFVSTSNIEFVSNGPTKDPLKLKLPIITRSKNDYSYSCQ